MIKNIIIILLILIIIYLNISNISKFYKNIRNEYYSSKLLDIKYDLDTVNLEKTVIEKYIDENINEKIKDRKLKEILEYVLSDGKKVRPIIFNSIYKKLTTFDFISNSDYIPKKCMIAVEYIHTASLIIDDIMDDDDYRRGKLALHAKYNLSVAQIAAILLLSLGIENIYEDIDELYNKHKDTNKDLSLIIGKLYSGILKELTLGQYYDITLPEEIFVENKLKGTELIIHKKTSSLFEYCFCVPFILANYNKSTEVLNEGIIKMKELAKNFGLMFQIADDFEDYLQDLEKESDNNECLNYVIQMGYYDAMKEYKKIVSDFTVKATNENVLTNELMEIEGYLSKKVSLYYNDYKNHTK